MSYTPPIRIKTDTDDFAELRLASTVFVDKSLLIKEFLDDGSMVALIARPRRWGKSLNMDMLGRFLGMELDAQGNPLPQESSLNYKLFAGGEVDRGDGHIKALNSLKISSYPEIMRLQGR